MWHGNFKERSGLTINDRLGLNLGCNGDDEASSCILMPMSGTGLYLRRTQFDEGLIRRFSDLSVATTQCRTMIFTLLTDTMKA